MQGDTISTQAIKGVLQNMLSAHEWPASVSYAEYRARLCQESPKLTACVERSYPDTAIFLNIGTAAAEEDPLLQRAVHTALARRQHLELVYEFSENGADPGKNRPRQPAYAAYTVLPPFPVEGAPTPLALVTGLRADSMYLQSYASPEELAQFTVQVQQAYDQMAEPRPKTTPLVKPHHTTPDKFNAR